jgi:hypothetical protein
VLGVSDHVTVSFFKLHGSMTQKVCWVCWWCRVLLQCCVHTDINVYVFQERTDVFKTFRAADAGVLVCTVSASVYFSYCSL